MYFFHTVAKPVRIDALMQAHDVIRPSGFYFPGESHDFWEVVYVCSGMATVTADERVYHLDSGKMVFHKPMEFHRIWAEGNSAPHLIILSFKASGEWISQFENSCFALNAVQHAHIKTVSAAFIKALALHGSADIRAYQLAVERAASELENFLLQLLEKEEAPQEFSRSTDVQYTRIVNVMKANCHRSLSLDELAKECDLTVSNMKRIFRRFSDMGVGKYYLSLRMRRAMELLDEGISACEVARLLDFSENSYFYTVFKRETGMTPTQYKRSHSSASETVRN